MGRNNGDFSSGAQKFENRLDAAAGLRPTENNRDTTGVRVSPKEVGTTLKGFQLRSWNGRNDKEATSPIPNRTRDINKTVKKLRKAVSE